MLNAYAILGPRVTGNQMYPAHLPGISHDLGVVKVYIGGHHSQDDAPLIIQVFVDEGLNVLPKGLTLSVRSEAHDSRKVDKREVDALWAVHVHLTDATRYGRHGLLDLQNSRASSELPTEDSSSKIFIGFLLLLLLIWYFCSQLKRENNEYIQYWS